MPAGSLSPVVADGQAIPGLVATVATPRVYVDGPVPATLEVTNTGPDAVALNVALVRTDDSVVVHRWSTAPLAPGTTQALSWDAAAHPSPERTTDLQFQVWTAPPASSAIAAQLSPVPVLADTFALATDAFPVDGRHDYGLTGEGRFGMGRSGHAHQGQDVFARCGTPVLAAHAGTVQFAEFQGSAGNYVVIDGDGTGQDTAYMHLRDPALPEEGEHVATGQLVGFVGDTGAASECHLHFELWAAPGWYEGGRPLDPLAALRRWER